MSASNSSASCDDALGYTAPDDLSVTLDTVALAHRPCDSETAHRRVHALIDILGLDLLGKLERLHARVDVDRLDLRAERLGQNDRELRRDHGWLGPIYW